MPTDQAEEDGMAADDTPGRSRWKRLLQGAGALSGATLAGCLGGSDENGLTDGDEGNRSTDDDEVTGSTDGEEETGTDDGDDTADVDTSEWYREIDAEADPDAATDWDNYEVTQLVQVDNLMSIDVDPDDRIWYINRGAGFPTYGDGTCEVGWVDADGNHEVVLELDVSNGAVPEDWGVESWDDLEDDAGGGEEDGDEEEEEEAGPPEMATRELGGQGVAIDPDFAENGYVYVWYHPSSEDQDEVENPYHENISMANARVSRFEYGDGELDPDSEEIVLEIPYNRMTCCHHGGYLEFGPEGDLYITTGDNSNNVGNPDNEVNWFMGDEREGEVHGRPAAVSDAQRSSGNTADLRGAILRITPTEDGCEIPEGNLKDVYEEQTGEEWSDEEFRPEIYSMGFRNPYVIHADEHTGNLWVSDYANDATSWEVDQGPMGIATHFLICEPINGGWPYFKAFYPYRYYDYETGEPGQPFWPENLRNRSPNNTGIENLPDVTPATLWHSNNWDEYENAPAWVDMPRPGEISWPELPASGSANAGVAYRYPDEPGEGALDPYFEGAQFIMTPFVDGWVGYVHFNEDGTVEIDDFLPDEFAVPTDMAYDSQGRLYLMDYGEGFGGEGENRGVHLIEYTG